MAGLLAALALLAAGVGCFGARRAGTNADAVDAPDAATSDAATDAVLDADARDATDASDAIPNYHIRENCFGAVGDDSRDVPDYDQFGAIPGSHCKGTNHQDIRGIQKLVFLGDSVTEGTPPTPSSQYYRSLVENAMRERFGDIEAVECADWGARTDDLMLPPHQQVLTCFPGVEPKKTLVVMTLGGNDMANCAQDSLSADACLTQVQEAVGLFEAAIRHLKDPANFPNGSYVVYGNVFEFTDGTGDLLSCPQSILAGYPADWDQGRDAYIRINEEFMRIAVATDSDLVFMLESFCGHGFHAADPAGECYRGEGAETWFDFTCIHPNPTGHAALADLIIATIDE